MHLEIMEFQYRHTLYNYYYYYYLFGIKTQQTYDNITSGTCQGMNKLTL